MNQSDHLRSSDQTGFSLFEVLIAAFILAVAIAGLMQLHQYSLRATGSNAELQRAYGLLFNAQQQAQTPAGLNGSALNAQARQLGLNDVQWIETADFLGLQWRAWDAQTVVRRGGCVADANYNCIQVKRR